MRLLAEPYGTICKSAGEEVPEVEFGEPGGPWKRFPEVEFWEPGDGGLMVLIGIGVEVPGS